MQEITTSSRQRTAVRSIFGVPNSVPVLVIPDGHLAPRLLGRRGGHFTRGGARIAHPGAYARRGWSNMVYRTSSRRIAVGERWLATVQA